MGNRGSAPIEEPAPPAPEEEIPEHFGVTIDVGLVNRLANQNEKVAPPTTKTESVTYPATLEPPAESSKHEYTPYNQASQQPEAQRPEPIDTEKLSEMLEYQRAQRRAESDAKHVQQYKQEDEVIKEIHNKIDGLRTTHAANRNDSSRMCIPERKAVLQCYNTSTHSEDLLKCRSRVDQFVECANRVSK